MGALFEAAMNQQQQQTQKTAAEPKVTPEEQQKFLSAMKDPEFRSLLNDYMEEISDPRNRAETEQYLAQLENEQKVPADKQLVKPKPGFVVKTKWDAAQKLFVNVCSSDKMQPPSSTRVTSGQQGTSWNLPYSLGLERLEPDKGGSGVPTFDVCFHPRVIEFAMARADYRHMVISTCLDAVEPILRDSRRKQKAVLARNYHILKGVFYKSGDPVTMCLRKERDVLGPTKAKTTKKITALGDKENAPPAQTITQVGGKADDSVLNQLTHVKDKEKNTALMKEVSSVKLEPKQKLDSHKQKKKMEHQLIYRGNFELLHHMQADPGNKVPEDRYRPKELVVEVSFPLSTSAKGLDLDVSERMLRLSAGPSVPGNYEPLELALPFPVIEEKGSAKFDRKNHKLVVTLPVQPPPKPKPQSVSLIVQDEDEEEEDEEVGDNVVEAEPNKSTSPKASAPKQQKMKEEEGEDEFRMLRETALMVANDPQVLAHAQPQAQAQAQAQYSVPVSRLSPPVVTEPAAIKDDIYDDLPPLESCSDEEDDVGTSENVADTEKTPETLPTATDPAAETSKVEDIIKPPFETHDTEACLSYIVNVSDIDLASVKLTFPSPSSLNLRFSDKKQREYEMQVAVLPVDIEPSTAEFNVASENMVIILEKKTTPASQTKTAEQPNIESPAPPLAAARFQNQLLYELD
ncbi:hypothetical protein PHYSODRAFT_511746 [Phytophthora sojae]|uniref:Protein kintoun n=1 Tax=Phytophthora sojae (strain P6497) TaxID=1094619 RepID=G4ZSA8_PHYSP|nr:hypothetical protein PHYSODRAFT_511746 [Phytophthora sojae]EGZ13004.1 hypothetical protein PHYSODRAFT_511746 [Phytophthora sojae]|eukprot:XP_009530433.1 hypothetical protein PHYSODRAFT_511746 [Phytophthora sojae]